MLYFLKQGALYLIKNEKNLPIYNMIYHKD